MNASSPTKFERLTLGSLGVAFAVVAVLGWFAPDVLFAPIAVSIGEPAGYAEIRAAYGGLFGASAILSIGGALRVRWTPVALALGAITLSGFVLGRMISLAVDGVPAGVAWAALGAELVGLGACSIALRLRNRRR